MGTLLPVLIVVIILGALLGGKSFGGVVRKGCGFLVLILVVILTIGVIIYSQSDSQEEPETKEAIKAGNRSTYFIVLQDCQTYTKPNIESTVSGGLDIGDEFFVENVDKFNYFYEISDGNGISTYVRKECLIEK